MEFMSKYICVFKNNSELEAIIIPAPNKDTAEFIVNLEKILEPTREEFDVISITKFNPIEHISLRIH
jgi:hypothetical protein